MPAFTCLSNWLEDIGNWEVESSTGAALHYWSIFGDDISPFIGYYENAQKTHQCPLKTAP